MEKFVTFAEEEEEGTMSLDWGSPGLALWSKNPRERRALGLAY